MAFKYFFWKFWSITGGPWLARILGKKYIRASQIMKYDFFKTLYYVVKILYFVTLGIVYFWKFALVKFLQVKTLQAKEPLIEGVCGKAKWVEPTSNLFIGVLFSKGILDQLTRLLQSCS